LQALNDDDISRVINWKSEYEIWNNLVVIHDGASQVKMANDFLHSQYEKFNMNENESIDDMIIKSIKITNGLSSLSDSIDNEKKMRKVIQALPQSWKVKSTTLK